MELLMVGGGDGHHADAGAYRVEGKGPVCFLSLGIVI